MKPATYPKLLKDLQKLQKRLVAAYISEARADAGRMARMAERWQAAEVGGRVDDFLDVCARRSAVQLLLRTVYVRVLEDLGALHPPRIRGQWGLAAFKEVAPALGLRGYLRWVFRDLAKDFPALFTPGPDELPLPAEDAVREIWALWHDEDGKGGLVYDWQSNGEPASFDSRFLGDLYQDLDAEVRKHFALLQTPVFVEEYILDHTLTPALAEFDPAALREKGDAFRLIDPTCGSGHFLIGAFHRLADWWEARGLDRWDATARALESVWGADINPHAVDIARFRLLLEVRSRTGVTDLDRLATLPLHLAVMDTLIPWERLEKAPELFPQRDRLSRYATATERSANAAFLGHDFHVAVGNPPYITPKDTQKRDDYRLYWESCHAEYTLSVPFAERFLSLPVAGGYSGQITSNSFAKRGYGKRLIESILPRYDLHLIVDTSGAAIPSHGTPTIILFARNQEPTTDKIAMAIGLRGERSKPENHANAPVWTALVRATEARADVPGIVNFSGFSRKFLASWPWSLKNSLSIDIQQAIEGAGEPTAWRSLSVGTGINTGENRAFETRLGQWPHLRGYLQSLTVGEDVKDWYADRSVAIPWSSSDRSTQATISTNHPVYRALWPQRTWLDQRRLFKVPTKERGIPYYHVREFYADKYQADWHITYPLVTTQNNFALATADGRELHSALLIAGRGDASIALDLLGLLNSSTLGFWMKQVFHDKGGGGIGGGLATEDWEHFYEYDATKLKMAPLTKKDRAARVALARALDAAAQERAACLPAAILATDWTVDDLATRLSTARTDHAALTRRMVALQEELDWLSYGAYGLLDDLDDPPTVVGPADVEPLSPGHRPFEILAAQADAAAPPEEKSAWWDRHGHPKVTEIPDSYSPAHRARLQARIDAIEASDKLQLLESFPFKRRWQLPDLDHEAEKAARAWLLDRLEDLFAPGGRLATPRPHRLEAIVAAWTADPRVAAVAAVAEGTADLDLTLLAERLLSAESLPDNPRRLYTAAGLRKLDRWKEVWALQDREDTGESVGPIDKPPEFERQDFVRPEQFATRGKLNVPRERFIQFADLSPVRYGWNGWRDLDRALAAVEAFTEAEGDPNDPLPVPSHADPRRCGVTLGLWESLDDVRRWSGADHHAELRALAQEACRQDRCPCDVVKRWTAWVNGEFRVDTRPADTSGEVTVDERARLTQALGGYGKAGTTPVALARAIGWPVPRVQAVLDDLVASGHATATGAGLRRMFALPDGQANLF